MFGQMDPPEVWLHISPLADMRDDTRQVTFRIKVRGEKSLSCTEAVSRYAPEGSIFRACGAAIDQLEAAQVRVTKLGLKAALSSSFLQWVEPF
jgi:hypothetical protein